MDRINVTKSSMPGFDEYMEELRPVWDSRWLSNRGAASKKFEEELKKYLGVEHVYCFANGHVAEKLSQLHIHIFRQHMQLSEMD